MSIFLNGQITPCKLYTIPCDTEDHNKAVKVADSWEEFLMLINEERVDIENNYVITELELTVK
jgi:hypothetical protein